jgi:hypothetical protein
VHIDDFLFVHLEPREMFVVVLEHFPIPLEHVIDERGVNERKEKPDINIVE